jgi:hypothetical protein
MASKLPYFPFYAGDWLSDEKLRACSFAARGLWTDLLCLMHKNDRRGYLQLNGKPVDCEALARMTGGTTEEVSRLLAELFNAGVTSVSEHGILYSRRMTRDEYIRQVRSAAGLKGADVTNSLPRQKSRQTAGKVSAKGSASESESSSKRNTPPNPPAGGKERAPPEFPENLKTEAFAAAWEKWLRYRTEMRKPLKPSSLAAQLKTLSAWGHEAACKAIEQSIVNGWQGLFEPRNNSRPERPQETAAQRTERVMREMEEGKR